MVHWGLVTRKFSTDDSINEFSTSWDCKVLEYCKTLIKEIIKKREKCIPRMEALNHRPGGMIGDVAEAHMEMFCNEKYDCFYMHRILYLSLIYLVFTNSTYHFLCITLKVLRMGR